MDKITPNSDTARKTANIFLKTGSYLIYFDKPEDSWIKLPNGNKIPCYCNCRYLNGYPSERKYLGDLLSKMVAREFTNLNLIAGIATAGISWATQIANNLNMPLAYVRGRKKAHGVGKLVECRPKRDLKTVLVDDALFSGDASIKAIEALKREFNIKVVGIASLVALSDWDAENYWKVFKKNNIKVRALTNYSYLLDLLTERNLLSLGQKKILESFYRSPTTFRYTYK